MAYGSQMMTSSMTSVTMKGQGRDPNIFHARYFDISKMARDRDSVTTGNL